MLGFAVKQGLERLDFESSAKICHLVALLYEALSLSWKCMLDNASRQCQRLVILLTRLWLATADSTNGIHKLFSMIPNIEDNKLWACHIHDTPLQELKCGSEGGPIARLFR
jgi:hypothetical protein